MDATKSMSSLLLLGLFCLAVTEAAHVKRQVILAAPAVAVAAPIAVKSHVVHTNPTTVVKTEQVHAGDHASYSYSTEVRSHPVVHQTVAAAPVVTSSAVVSAPVVSTVHHTVPAYTYSLGYPYYSYGYPYYSPLSYVVKK